MSIEPPEDDARVVELNRLLEGHPGVTLHLGWPEAVAIVATIDLALSHPMMAESEATPVIRAMQAAIIKLLSGDNLRIATMLKTGMPPAEWN